MRPLIVSGTLDSLKAIAEYVMAAVAAAGLDKKTSYKLRQAVDEIATNIITYGYQEAACSGVLALQADLDEQSLTISIEDTGIPYDPTQQSAPDNLDKPLEQRQVGGLGIYLAIQGVDKFIYERVGDRNRNIFIVNRKAITAKEGALVQGCETYGFWLGLIGLFLAGCSQPTANSPLAPPPPAVTVSQPIDKEVLEWDEYTGRLEAIETVDVRARVSGYLEKVNFKDGSKVQKGDLLFVIDPRPYQAELDRAKAELQRVRARLELAKNDLARAERLFRKRAISEEELDTRTKGLRETEATVNSAAAAVQTARLNVEFTQVRAPISGRISRELVTVGNLVNGGAGEATVLATIVSIDPIYVYIDADEHAVLKYRRLAREGTRVSAREVQIPIELALADEEGFPHKGVIDYVEPRLDPNTGTVRGRGVFANPDDQLGPGFFARVRVPGSGQYQALLITDHAIATDQSQKFVLVVNDQNVAEYRAVKLGPRIGGLRVITEGLKPGDWVVVNGLQRVRPGMPVKPQRAPMPTQPEMAQAVSFAPPPPSLQKH